MKKLLLFLLFACLAGAAFAQDEEPTPTATATTTASATASATSTPTATATGTPVPTPTPVALVYRRGKQVPLDPTGTQPVDNIYMNPNADIGHSGEAGDYFNVGRSDAISGNDYMVFPHTGAMQLVRNGLNAAIYLDLSLVTAARNVQWQNSDGVVAYLANIPTALAAEPFITKTASSNLSNEFAMGSLATGIVKNTTTTGVPTIAVAGTDYLAPAAIGVTVQGWHTQLDVWRGTTLSTDDTFSAPDNVSVASTLATQVYVAATVAVVNSYTDTVFTEFAGDYKNVFESSGYLTAAQTAGKYAIPSGEQCVLTGIGSAYPIKIVYIDSADFYSYNGIPVKLRIRALINTNDVAPTGNFTFGLYPVTRPGTSGGAGVAIYSLGTVVSGSNGATWTAPAADLMDIKSSADFALPANGYYALVVLTTATVATSAHVHFNARLQYHNQ